MLAPDTWYRPTRTRHVVFGPDISGTRTRHLVFGPDICPDQTPDIRTTHLVHVADTDKIPISLWAIHHDLGHVTGSIQLQQFINPSGMFEKVTFHDFISYFN